MPRQLGGGAPSAPPQIPSPTSAHQALVNVLPSGAYYGTTQAPTSSHTTNYGARDTNIRSQPSKPDSHQGDKLAYNDTCFICIWFLQNTI